MTVRGFALLMIALTWPITPMLGADAAPWWKEDVAQALERAAANRGELEKALTAVPEEQRAGMAFLVANMPENDLKSLKADFLLANCALAYRARKEAPWGRAIPEDVFLNDVLPYANVDEKRDEWRQEFFELCWPIVRECKTPSEAAHKLNQEIFKKVNVRYSTKRKAPNQSPRESMEGGTASCTGLSIILSNACRAVCVPARLVGTPLWANKSGNHTWVEIWDKGWHFTGACEPDPEGLNRGWFIANAAQARADSFEHSIYAASFRKSAIHFPLVWARSNKDVPAENVTSRYAKQDAVSAEKARLAIRVVDAEGKRVAAKVEVVASGDAQLRHDGASRGENADANDLLTFDLLPDRQYLIKVGGVEKTVKSPVAGKEQVVEIALPAK